MKPYTSETKSSQSDTLNEVENEVAAGSEEVAKDTQLDNDHENPMAHVSDFVESLDDQELSYLRGCLSSHGKSKASTKDKIYSLDNVEKSLDEPEELEEREMND